MSRTYNTTPKRVRLARHLKGSDPNKNKKNRVRYVEVHQHALFGMLMNETKYVNMVVQRTSTLGYQSDVLMPVFKDQSRKPAFMKYLNEFCAHNKEIKTLRSVSSLSMSKKLPEKMPYSPSSYMYSFSCGSSGGSSHTRLCVSEAVRCAPENIREGFTFRSYKHEYEDCCLVEAWANRSSDSKFHSGFACEVEEKKDSKKLYPHSSRKFVEVKQKAEKRALRGKKRYHLDKLTREYNDSGSVEDSTHSDALLHEYQQDMTWYA